MYNSPHPAAHITWCCISHALAGSRLAGAKLGLGLGLGLCLARIIDYCLLHMHDMHMRTAVCRLLTMHIVRRTSYITHHDIATSHIHRTS
jgi:hypothetical protein